MELLGITRQTLDNYVNRGIVERKKLGSKNFYSFSNIQSAIDKGKIHKSGKSSKKRDLCMTFYG